MSFARIGDSCRAKCVLFSYASLFNNKVIPKYQSSNIVLHAENAAIRIDNLNCQPRGIAIMRLPSTAQLIAIKTMNIIGTPIANINTDCATLSAIVLSGVIGDGCEVLGRTCFLGVAIVVLSAEAFETGTSRPDGWLSGDFMPSVAAAATAVPQLPQKAVPASNCVPHFVQKAIKIPPYVFTAAFCLSSCLRCWAETALVPRALLRRLTSQLITY